MCARLPCLDLLRGHRGLSSLPLINSKRTTYKGESVHAWRVRRTRPTKHSGRESSVTTPRLQLRCDCTSDDDGGKKKG